MAFSFAFDNFGCPPGIEKEANVELASAFFEVRDFDDFRMEKLRSPRGAGGRGGDPLNPPIGFFSVAIPSRPAAPLRGVRRMKGYALCRRPPVNRKLVTGRT